MTDTTFRFIPSVDHEDVFAQAYLCDTSGRGTPASVTLYLGATDGDLHSFSHYTPASARALALDLLKAAEEADKANEATADPRTRRILNLSHRRGIDRAMAEKAAEEAWGIL